MRAGLNDFDQEPLLQLRQNAFPFVDLDSPLNALVRLQLLLMLVMLLVVLLILMLSRMLILLLLLSVADPYIGLDGEPGRPCNHLPAGNRRRVLELRLRRYS